MRVGDTEFATGCDLLEATSLHRPDTAWCFVDAKGHEHRWYVNGQPAATYRPEAQFETPTLVWVKDGEEYWEDDEVDLEPHDVGHLECRECGAHVKPGYKPDDCIQHIPGLRWFRINGESVSKEEFERRVEEERARWR